MVAPEITAEGWYASIGLTHVAFEAALRAKETCRALMRIEKR
jgi:hypothetical protein